MIFTTINSSEIKAGAPNSSLGATGDMSQLELNRLLLEKIETLNITVADLAARLMEAEKTGVVSTNTKKSIYAGATTPELNLTKSTDKLSWDLTELINSLPEGTNLRRIRVTLDGADKPLVDSNKPIADIPTTTSNYPIILNAEVRTQSEIDGFVNYHTQFVVENKDADVKIPLKSTALDDTITLNKQSEVNNYLITEVNTLRKMLI